MIKSPLIIVVAVMASLLEIIDSSIVNVALPTMMGNLGATIDEISMVVTGYAIANAIVLPVSSWLGERLGRRRYYLGCIVGFTVTSVACGLAPNLTTLIVFRIFQGLFGGALLPTSQALIYEQFPKEKAGMAGALFGMSVMIGPTLGPVMGGYLTDEYGWRSIFNINLPLGMVAFLIGSAVIFNRTRDSDESTASPNFDGIGLALLVLGVGCLQFVLERGEANGWLESTSIAVNMVIAAICLPSFILWELKTPHPIINIRLFKLPIVANGVGLMTGLGFFLYGVVFTLPVFLGLTFHYTATQIGEFFIPGSILTALLMPFIGRAMAGGVNSKLLIFIGLVAIEICLYMMTLFSPMSTKWEILQMLFVRGIAMAFLFVPINSSILSQFKGAEMGQVSGLLNLFRQLGGSAGIALVGTLLTVNGKQNYSDFLPRLSQLNAATQQSYSAAVHAINAKMPILVGYMPNRGTMAAVKMIYHRVEAQVFMLSFLQLIWIMMMIFAISFVPLYFLKLTIKPKGAISDAH